MEIKHLPRATNWEDLCSHSLEEIWMASNLEAVAVKRETQATNPDQSSLATWLTLSAFQVMKKTTILQFRINAVKVSNLNLMNKANWLLTPPHQTWKQVLAKTLQWLPSYSLLIMLRKDSKQHTSSHLRLKQTKTLEPSDSKSSVLL